MIKIAQLIGSVSRHYLLIRHPLGNEIDNKMYIDGFDNEIFKKSRKRTGLIKIRVGQSGDDFVVNMISIILEANTTKLPRFMNPLRGRRKGKLKKS